ncbi:hypothetical protein K437DRAFT_48845 [Tilletiaria anomala UBC 951]|uniref:Uncharacterized protein n=1 Tax=Tilletiaria anomala (strain ATCC 24038 / CBS 436.72 / UBC 951) TaxID=1037660 RepID=A0A066V916_TILAU|nr:uncharacterized protein K437DRAFT_48845 [Tilletiaria anomala UBC 951]KDN36773.1 hypothetical protein K437DRAFT_48845 [Tilletiaria anomala UBC 951]
MKRKGRWLQGPISCRSPAQRLCIHAALFPRWLSAPAAKGPLLLTPRHGHVKHASVIRQARRFNRFTHTSQIKAPLARCLHHLGKCSLTSPTRHRISDCAFDLAVLFRSIQSLRIRSIASLLKRHMQACSNEKRGRFCAKIRLPLQGLSKNQHRRQVGQSKVIMMDLG